MTLVQYIGELCRYLVNAPDDPLDKDNKVRLMFGNGLRPDVWRKFQERFGVESVFESYTMSEGKKNIEGGAIDQVVPYLCNFQIVLVY